MRSETRESLEPTCPFCGSKLKRPATIEISAMENVLGGTCSACGAIYIVDPTSKNVGEVMMQALGLAAEKLSKDLSEMIAGEDYEDAVLNYDVRTHRSTGISKGFMDGYGRLYIIKVKRKPA
ncbi:MAG: hypothetical protein ACM3MD_00130 [Betaproteobacteria bacterium]